MKLCDQEGIWTTQLKSIHYSLNYSLAACSQDNSHPKLPTKVETQKITAIYCLWMVDNERGERVAVEKENFKANITFNMKSQYNYQPLSA